MLSVMPDVVKTLYVSHFTLITIWFDIIFILQLRKQNPERLSVFINWFGCFEFILCASIFLGAALTKALKQRRTTKLLHWGAAEEPAGCCGAPEDRAGLWTEAVGPHSTHSPGLVFVPMCMCCAKLLQSCLTLCSPLDSGPPGYMGFSRQEYWSGLPCHPSGDLPDPGIEPTSLKSPDLAGWFFTSNTTWEAQCLPYLWCKRKVSSF